MWSQFKNFGKESKEFYQCKEEIGIWDYALIFILQEHLDPNMKTTL